LTPRWISYPGRLVTIAAELSGASLLDAAGPGAVRGGGPRHGGGLRWTGTCAGA